MQLPKKKFLPKRPLSSPGAAAYCCHVDNGLCEAYLTAMEVLAKPWNGVLIVALEGGPLRFSELSARVPAIGDRMLAARLKELEAQGLLVRRVEPGPPVRVSY